MRSFKITIEYDSDYDELVVTDKSTDTDYRFNGAEYVVM